MKKLKLISILGIFLLLLSNCNRDGIKLPKSKGFVSATMNGENWPNNKQFIAQSVHIDWNKESYALPCYKNKINIDIILFENQFGYTRFFVRFDKILPQKGITKLLAIDLANNEYPSACDHDFPSASAAYFVADGDAGSSGYDIKKDSESYLEITEIDLKNKIIKGKFSIHLVQDTPKNERDPAELIFTNGKFETTIR